MIETAGKASQGHLGWEPVSCSSQATCRPKKGQRPVAGSRVGVEEGSQVVSSQSASGGVPLAVPPRIIRSIALVLGCAIVFFLAGRLSASNSAVSNAGEGRPSVPNRGVALVDDPAYEVRAWRDQGLLCTQVVAESGGGGGLSCGQANPNLSIWSLLPASPVSDGSEYVVTGVAHPDVSEVSVELDAGRVVDAKVITCPCPGSLQSPATVFVIPIPGGKMEDNLTIDAFIGGEPVSSSRVTFPPDSST